MEINGLNRSTVYRQVEMLGSGEKIGYGKGETGPQSKLNDEEVLIILDYMTLKDNVSCSDVVAHLKTEVGISVSSETVRKLLVTLGFQ